MSFLDITTKPCPKGTQVVTTEDIKLNGVVLVKKGSVGIIIGVECGVWHGVRLPNGDTVVMHRNEFVPQKDTFRAVHLEQELNYDTIKPYLQFEVITGSTAYGLTTPESDIDYKGGYLIPSNLMWGMKKYKDTVDRHNPDGAYHEIGKLLQLACQGNPNIMELGEILKIPELVIKYPTNEFLGEIFSRWYELFLSKYVFKAYSGYAISQLNRIKADLRNGGEVRWKHACHLVRLLWSGIQCMKTGQIIIRPPDEVKKYLLDIKAGQYTLTQLEPLVTKLQVEFEEEFHKSKLPERANFEEANKLLIGVREDAYLDR